ncbi:MAG: TetR family transcriptional regulator [Streptosporangiales bacterium]
MPRIAEARPAAEPSSPRQVERYRRILRAAADLAAEKGLERVQMHDVAKDAEVAIGTLYRYFPSKTHLFTTVMAAQVRRFEETTPECEHGEDPEDAVYRTLVRASRSLVRRPLLAIAMLQSANSANVATVPDAGQIDNTFRDLVLRILRLDTPTAKDVTLVRLLLQCWYGVLSSSLNGRMSLPDAEADIRLACRLLLATRSNAGAAEPSR